MTTTNTTITFKREMIQAGTYHLTNNINDLNYSIIKGNNCWEVYGTDEDYLETKRLLKDATRAAKDEMMDETMRMEREAEKKEFKEKRAAEKAGKEKATEEKAQEEQETTENLEDNPYYRMKEGLDNEETTEEKEEYNAPKVAQHTKRAIEDGKVFQAKTNITSIDRYKKATEAMVLAHIIKEFFGSWSSALKYAWMVVKASYEKAESKVA